MRQFPPKPAPQRSPWLLIASLAVLTGIVAWWQSASPPPVFTTHAEAIAIAGPAATLEAARANPASGAPADTTDDDWITPIMARSDVDTKQVPARAIIASRWKAESQPQLAAFAQWTESYLEARPQQRAQLLPQGVAAARERRDALETLISSDPQRALAAAVPLSVRDQLPPQIQSELEERISGFGDLYRVHTTPLPGGAGVRPIDYAKIGAREFQASRYGTRESLPSLKEVSIHGIAVDNKLAVADSPVRLLETGEAVAGKVINQTCVVSGKTVAALSTANIAAEDETTFAVGNNLFGTCEPEHVVQVESVLAGAEATGTRRTSNHDLQKLYVSAIHALSDSAVAGETGYIGRPPASLTKGGKNILIMRVQPNDNHPFPASATVASFTDTVTRADGWNNRIKRCSYNQAWIVQTDVTPVFTLPQNSAYYTRDGSGNPAYSWGRWLDDSKAICAANGYNLNNYAAFVVAHAGYSEFGAAGWGGGGSIWCNGNFDVRLFVHEYGHVFWLPHANSWTSTDGDPMSAARAHVEYGDAADPMGNAWGAGLNNEYNAYYKNFCGWLPDSSVQVVARDGTYRIYQNDGATALNRTLALKIARDYALNYWVAFRGESISQNSFNNGASFLAVAGSRPSDTHLVDLNNPSGDSANAPLAVGQTWYDSVADITFKTIAVGGASPNRYLDLQVTFGTRYIGGFRPLVSGGIYRLRNKNNNKYLEVPGNGTADGIAVQVATASGSAAQNWVAARNSDGSYGFNHQGTNKWLDVSGNSGADGAEIQQWTANPSDAQRWYVMMDADESLRLIHKGTEKVLDMDPGNVNDVHQWGAVNGPWQNWIPELGIIPGNYRLAPRHAPGSVIDVVNGNPNDGADTQIRTWWGGQMQQWQLSDLGSGRFRFSPLHATTKALDVWGAGTVNGTAIRLSGF
ncbi:MAG: RICIN domain-containing protein, partial [Verrucomicrobiota bacterium]